MENNNSNLSIKSEEEEDDHHLSDSDSACMLFGTYTHKGEEKKSQELFELLKNWKLLELFEHFTNEKIDLEVLSVIKPHHFEKLLEPFNLRTLIMFEHNLQQWRSSIGFPLSKYPDTTTTSNFGPLRVRKNSLSKSSSSQSSSFKDITTSIKTSPTNEQTDDKLSLDTILNSSMKGKMLTDIYNETLKFEEVQRTLLIHLIAEYFNDKGIHLSLADSYNIEKQIIAKFPTEQLEYYRTSKRGRIYNKCCNHKYAMIKVARSSMPKTTSSTETDENVISEPIKELVPEEDAEEMTSLLNNENLTDEQFDAIWKKCTKFRINELGKHPLSESFSKWPKYKSPNGYKYIAMDFKQLEPKWNALVENWDTVSEKLLNFLTKGQTIKTSDIKTVLTNIKENDISKNCRDAALLWCLHGYLKPTHIISGTNDEGKKSVSKISIKDSQDAFIYVGKTIEDIDKHRELLLQQYEKVDPFIGVLGDDITNFEMIFVCLEDIKLEFPTACKAVWSFIQNMFFETKPKTHFPRVHILINELRGN